MAGGRGHVRKRGLVYYVVLELEPHPDGRRRQSWVRTDARTKKDAEQERTRLLRERDTGSALDPTRMTVGAYLTHWLDTNPGGRLGDTTREKYRECADRDLLPHLGATLLVKLTPLHVARCYAALTARGLAPRTVRHRHGILFAALAQAVAWRMIPVNVAATETPSRGKQGPRDLWDAATLQRFLALAAGHRLEGFCHLLAGTGMRRGELLGLQWRDVDLDGAAIALQRNLVVVAGQVVVRPTKTPASRRRITLAAVTVAALRAHRARQEEGRARAGAAWEDRDLVFPNHGGKPHWPGNVETLWGTLQRAAGVAHLRIHDMRHLHATLLLEAGIHPKVVQERLGHTSITITMDLYSHVTGTMQQVAADAIDRILHAAPAPALVEAGQLAMLPADELAELRRKAAAWDRLGA